MHLTRINYQSDLIAINLNRYSSERLAIMLAVGILVISLVVWLVSAFTMIAVRGRKQRCPHCGSERTRSSWPRMSDYLLIGLRPFRCEACLRRYYLLRLVEPSHTKAIAGERVRTSV